MRSHRLLPLGMLAALVGMPGPIAEAQSPMRAHRVGILCPITSQTADVRIFRTQRAALDYAENGNVVFEYRSAEDELKRLPDLADQLVRLPFNVIYTTY